MKRLVGFLGLALCGLILLGAIWMLFLEVAPSKGAHYFELFANDGTQMLVQNGHVELVGPGDLLVRSPLQILLCRAAFYALFVTTAALSILLIRPPKPRQ